MWMWSMRSFQDRNTNKWNSSNTNYIECYVCKCILCESQCYFSSLFFACSTNWVRAKRNWCMWSWDFNLSMDQIGF